MRLLKDLFRLLHPINGFGSAIAVITGYWMTAQVHGLNFDQTTSILLFIITFASSGAGFVINDLFDIEIDRVNRPERPLPSGSVEPWQGILTYIFLIILSTLLSASINSMVLTVTAIINLFLFLYSSYFKKHFLFGHLIIASLGSILLFYGGLATYNPTPTIYTIFPFFLAFFARETLKTLPDLEGDKMHGIRNFATIYGVKKSLLICKAIFILAFATYAALSIIFGIVFTFLLCLLAFPLTLLLLMSIDDTTKFSKTIFYSKVLFLALLLPLVISTSTIIQS